jgi:hypothetical protein
MKFCGSVLCRKFSGKCEFPENQHSNSHTLLMGVNEILPIVSIFRNQSVTNDPNISQRKLCLLSVVSNMLVVHVVKHSFVVDFFIKLLFSQIT